MNIDPIIQKNLWEDQGEHLTQVTLPHGRYYIDENNNRHYSVSTILDKTMPGGKRAALQKWKDSIGEDAAEKIRQDSAANGTKMHELIENYLFGGFAYPEDSQCTGKAGMMFRQYRRGFLDKAHLVPTLIEAKLHYAPNGYGYAGSVDFCGGVQLPGEDEPILTVLDHKSINKIENASGRMPGYRKQLAAYFAAIRYMYGVDVRRGIVNFASTKGFRQYIVSFEEMEIAWKLFYQDLERFYQEGLYKEIYDSRCKIISKN